MRAQAVSRRIDRGGQQNVNSATRSVIERLERRALMDAAPALPGTLDPNLGVGGNVVLHTDDGGASFEDVIVQTDGKILAVGWTRVPDGQTDYLLARFNADGTADESFGNHGVVISDGGSRIEYGRGPQRAIAPGARRRPDRHDRLGRRGRHDGDAFQRRRRG
jgi:hypothetical protein